MKEWTRPTVYPHIPSGSRGDGAGENSWHVSEGWLRRGGLKSTQETGLENRILWCHWDRDLCPGLGWKGTPSPWQWADGGLGWWAGSFSRTNPICAPQKIKFFSKGCSGCSQVTVAVPLCALHSLPRVIMEVTMIPFSFPDLILPLRWRFLMQNA